MSFPEKEARHGHDNHTDAPEATIVKDFGDIGESSLTKSVKTSGAGHRKRSKRVQHDDERERVSEGDWSAPETFRPFHAINEPQQDHWDRGDYADDDDDCETPSAHVRDSPGTTASKSTTNLHRPMSADHIPQIFSLKIMPDELQDFNKSELQRSGTVPNMWDEERFSRELEKRHILTSFRNLDHQGQEAIEMWHTQDLPDEIFTHWRHIKRQFMDLEEFTNLALQTPHVRESRMRSILVEKFMAKVKETFSISARQGERTLHGVLRCDAHGIQDGRSTKISATWLCFPYLSKGDNYLDGISTKASKGLYRTRTLFQWSYEREPASERDERQAFLKEAKELLYVPQVWILLLGKDTIITSSPCSLKQLLPETVKLQPVSIERGRLQWIKLIGPYDREAVVPASDCGTFCALNISVTDVCFDGNDWEDTYDLFVKENRLTADLWLHFTANARSSILVVQIRTKRYVSRRDAISTSTRSSESNEESEAEVNCSASESLSESSSIRANAYDTGPDTPSDANIDNEETQSARVHDENGKQKDTVLRKPRSRINTQEATRQALSRVLPFLQWDLRRNYSVIDLSSQSMKQNKATTLFTLTNIHGRLGNPDHRFPAVEDVSPELNDEYLGNNLYAESPIEAFEQNGNEERADSMNPQSRDRNTKNDDLQSSPNRLPINRQLKKGCQVDPSGRMILKMVQSTKQLIAHFVPCSESHILLEKVWGALKVFSKTTTNPNSEHRHRLKQIKKWIVLGSHDSIMKMKSIYDIPNPDRHHYAVCEACDSSRAYDSTEDAVHHLIREHYFKTDLTEEATDALSLLVQTVEEAWMTGIREAHRAVLEVLLERLGSLQKVILKVKIGLAQNIGDSPPTYTLPRALIQVLEHLVGFILVCSHTARLIDSAYATWVPTEFNTTELVKVNHYIDFVDKFGKNTENLLCLACDDIYSMVRENMPSPRKVCKSVGLRYTTANLLRHLLVRPLVDDHSTVEFYVDMFSGLQYSVLHDHPRRRLFSRIHLLQEDIGALIKVRRTQQSVLENLRAALDPRTFHRAMGPTETSQCRSAMSILNSAVKNTLWDIRELQWILKQSLDLESRVKHRVEVIEEDHGKAIFVFTLVTAIFLPLSFVTSYMGMNTADIREMRATQERFWAVAVPVTAIVMVTAAFLAYKGHVVKTWLLSMPERLLSMPKWLSKSRTEKAEVGQWRQNVGTVSREKSNGIGLFGGTNWWRRAGEKNLGQSNQSLV